MLERKTGVLLQVLGDMVANALEATPPGGTVRVAWEAADGAGRFTNRPYNRLNIFRYNLMYFFQLCNSEIGVFFKFVGLWVVL
mgnify:CR=1 FL=1